MTFIRKRRNIYCFDADAFIVLGRTHERVIEIPSSLWNHLKKMMRNGQLISHRLVFDEISSGSKNPDFITKWLADKKEFFMVITSEQIRLVPNILREFPDLIDYDVEHEQADPWLIALAIEKSREQTLFHINVSIIVTQENPRSPKKIPAACKHFGVQYRFLKEFFSDVGINTQISIK